MKKCYYLLLPIASVLFSCHSVSNKSPKAVKEKSDQIFQYSVFAGFANKIYDGKLTVGQLMQNGDIGLGTFNGLNGELIMLDNKVYQLLSDGSIRQPLQDELVPFAVTTFFNEDLHLELAVCPAYADMKAVVEQKLPSHNLIYAFKIRGNFSKITCGGAVKQEKPYSNTLSEALVDRPQFTFKNVTGTMIGFWYPEHTGKLNIVGFHLHFISDDRKIAGHVMDFSGTNLKIGIDKIAEFWVLLPETPEFNTAVFDMSQEYNKPSAPAK
jgi:acetolactate decarboxylase